MAVRTEKLLTVTDSFVIKDRGLVVMPTIPENQFRASSTRMLVLLRKPEGTEARVLAEFTMPSVAHPKDLCFACLLRSLEKEDVPIGTEVHRFVEEEPNQSITTPGLRPSASDLGRST